MIEKGLDLKRKQAGHVKNPSAYEKTSVGTR